MEEAGQNGFSLGVLMILWREELGVELSVEGVKDGTQKEGRVGLAACLISEF